MPVHPTDAAASGLGVHGLRFLNDEWNDSISNGDSFTLRWNQSLAKLGTGLGVFKLTYPKDGVVVYELISNLTDNIEGDSCEWTPSNLEKKSLYAMWLTAGQDNSHPNWTLSPAWMPKEPSGNGASPWAAPFIIPVICLLGVYAASLTGYLVYRRRKKAGREQEDATPHQDASRNNSVDTDTTLQALSDMEGGPEKRSIVVYSDRLEDADVSINAAAAGSSIDPSEIERAMSMARRGRGGAGKGRRTGSEAFGGADVQRALSNVRRGRSSTTEGRDRSAVDRHDLDHPQSRTRRERSGTNEGRGLSTLGQYNIERAQGSVRRGRSGRTDRLGSVDQIDRSDVAQGSIRLDSSGTAERSGLSGGSRGRPPDIELAQGKFRRARSGTADRSGIRLVSDSGSASNATIQGEERRNATGACRAERDVHFTHERRDTRGL